MTKDQNQTVSIEYVLKDTLMGRRPNVKQIGKPFSFSGPSDKACDFQAIRKAENTAKERIRDKEAFSLIELYKIVDGKEILRHTIPWKIIITLRCSNDYDDNDTDTDTDSNIVFSI